MSLFIKIMLFAFTLLGIGIYANYLYTGKTPSIPQVSPDLTAIDLTNLTEEITDVFAAKDDSVKTYLYKWRDEKGVIYYTSEKPPEEIKNYKSIVISSETNVVPTVPVTNQAEIIQTLVDDQVYQTDTITNQK